MARKLSVEHAFDRAKTHESARIGEPVSPRFGEGEGGAPTHAAPPPLLGDLPKAASRETPKPPDPQGGTPEAWAAAHATPQEQRVAGEPIPGLPGRAWASGGRIVFAKGNKGGPKGNRAQLARKFFTNLYDVWEEQGDAVLRRAAFMEPMKFADMVSRLMPQKIEIRDTTLEDMDNDRLASLLHAIERNVERAVSRRSGDFAKTIEARADEAGESEPARLLPPIPEAG